MKLEFYSLTAYPLHATYSCELSWRFMLYVITLPLVVEACYMICEEDDKNVCTRLVSSLYDFWHLVANCTLTLSVYHILWCNSISVNSNEMESSYIIFLLFVCLTVCFTFNLIQFLNWCTFDIAFLRADSWTFKRTLRVITFMKISFRLFIFLMFVVCLWIHIYKLHVCL